MALTVVYKGYTIQGQGYAVNLAMKWVDRQG